MKNILCIICLAITANLFADSTTITTDKEMQNVNNPSTVKSVVSADHSFTTNGYQIFPSGLIMQWGYALTTNYYTSVPLPIPFPNAALNATASLGNAYSYTGYVGASPTNNTVITVASKSGAGIQVFWTAIGY